MNSLVRGRSRFASLAFAVVILWGLSEARTFLVPLLLASMIAFMLAPLARFFEKRGIPNWASVVFATLALVLPWGAVFYFVIMEVEALAEDWPRIYPALLQKYEDLVSIPWIQKLHLLSAPLSKSENGKGGEFALKAAGNFLSSFTFFVLVLFFSVIILASRKHIKKSAEKGVTHYFPNAEGKVIEPVVSLVQSFLLARLGIALLVGAAGWITLISVGVPYSLLLAGIYGLMTWVPVIGILLGEAPILAVAFATGMDSVKIVVLVAVLGLIWGIQDHILAPKWVGHRVKLNFLATYLAFFAGERLWGPWGMFLSIPIVGIIRIFLSVTPQMEPIVFALSEESPEVESKPLNQTLS